jgi:hypothetical protein
MVARATRVRGVFLDYIGDRLEGFVFWRLTTSLEVEELCASLVLLMGIGWDEISLYVIKMVAHEISGPLSCVLNCYIRGESLPGFV